MNIAKLLRHQKLFNTSVFNHRIIRHYVDVIDIESTSMSRREIATKFGERKKKARKIQAAYVNPSKVSLQILGSGMRGVPSSLYVSSDHSKYVFNCGEGTQRLANEHRCRVARMDNIFFTTPSWKNIGGLAGLTLTIQDMGVPDVNIHGPAGIIDMFEAIEHFVLLNTLNLKESDCSESNHYIDECMTVRYAHLKSSNSDADLDSDHAVFDDNTDYYSQEKNSNGKRNMRLQKPAQKLPREVVKNRKCSKTEGCVAYICKLHPKSGSLDLEKCVDKGVTPGPVLGKLKAGEDVTLEDGTVIKSSDVCSPPIPGPVFIVLECPSEDYLDSLMDHELFPNYQRNAEDKENIASYVVHFTPEKILQNPRYIEWMSRFPHDTQHLILNDRNKCYNFEALHRIQHELNLLYPPMFPIIHEKGAEGNDGNDLTEPEALRHLKIIRAKTCNAFHLRPADGLEDIAIRVNREGDVAEVFKNEGFLDALAELQTEINARSKFINESPAYPKIVMLGTGSCIPNKVRNTSGILLRIDEETSILMDCGEGTVGQLIRFFGPSESDKVLASIKGIYVSHLHADHHLGLIGVLQQRKSVTNEPVFLIAPKQIESWLNFYHRKFDHIRENYTLVPSKTLHLLHEKIDSNFRKEFCQKLKLNNVVTIDVPHCPHAFAVAWDLQCGKKIVYSGDTRPTANIVTIGQHCDLLIHEATMEDELLEEARKKMHSTISEAIEIGKAMHAKFTLLTHFSQRYSKMPRLPENDISFDNVGIAFDNMQFSMAELTLLPLFYPALRSMFSGFCNELNEKAQKRLARGEFVSKYKADRKSYTYT